MRLHGVPISRIDLSRAGRASALLATVVTLALAGCGGEAALPERSNILLITIDTLRADRLSAYGYQRDTSPVIDRLAAEGARFETPIVQWPKTGPSFASIFTATYPKNNGIVRKIGIPVPFEFRLVAEELKARGYATHAVVSNGAAASDFNFHQGFDSYLETWKLDPTAELPDPNRADGVTKLALATAERIGDERPFFLWVHYLDPHFPYTPPPPYDELFQGDAFYDPTERITIDRTAAKRDMGRIGAEQVLDGRDELAFYQARYDAEIAYVDSWVGRLMKGLEAEGLLDETLTVLTSDHGESLGEHSYMFDHGRFAFQTCLRVPLVVHYPGVIEPKVVRGPVELLGLAPTLLEAAGAELPDGRWMEGRSLSRFLFDRDGEAARGPVAFSEAGYGRQDLWQKAVLTDRYKLVDAYEGSARRWITGDLDQQYALYDLVEDPAETRNLIAEEPQQAERLMRLLARWQRSEIDPRVDTGEGPEAAREMDEETRRQLKALGYLD